MTCRLRPRRPFTGAWIETLRSARNDPSLRVAPSRGRGSKRRNWPFAIRRWRVAPSRGRGSKRQMGVFPVHRSGSPLHGGVDRNDTNAALTEWDNVAPSRGRGSKHFNPAMISEEQMSPLHGGVDRNYVAQGAAIVSRARRPFTGAWIETISMTRRRAKRRVAPSRGRGSKRRPAGRDQH